jgi:RNA polymerase sigma factor for flagellar operon FliA
MRAYAQQARRSPRDRDRLIVEHLEIARRISLRVARRCPSWVTADDLVAAGMLGLAEAAERYDETRQEPFLVFAEKRIRGAVLDELRRGDIMPRRSRQMARKIGAVIAELERKLGSSATDEQVADALGVPVAEYRDNLEHLVHVTVGSLDQLEHAPKASDEESPRQHSERRELLSRVRTALEQLPQRDVLILSLYYNDEMTYVEIAAVLGVTTSRVCQLHGRAIARLRAAIETVRPEAQTRHEDHVDG